MQVQDLSFDPRDPYFAVPGGQGGLQWAVQVFTTENVYGIDGDSARFESGEAGASVVADGLTWAGGQQRAPGRVEASVTRDGRLTYVWDIRAHMQGERIKAVKVKLRGLPPRALEAGWWHAGSDARDEPFRPTATSPLRWRYPEGMGWQTPWACAGDGGPAVCISVRDREVRPVRLYGHTPPYEDGPIVEVVTAEAATRWDGEYAAPPIRVTMASSAEEASRDFEEHLAWVTETYGLQPWTTRPDVPDWLREVRLVVNLHGQHYTGYIFNDFARMAEALRFCAEHIPGEQLLGFMPGWEGRYYYAYPRFEPAEALGGVEGFRHLVDTARELGVRLMPMFGAHGANAANYPGWPDVAFRNGTGQLAQLANIVDWDADRDGEDFIVFLNTANPTFQEYLIDQIDALVRDFSIDSVYLDTTGHYWNDSRHDLYDGYRTLTAELGRRHPDLVVAGEGWYDALLGVFPVNMSWVGVHRPVRRPELPADYARIFQHLVDGAPGWGSTGVYEGGFTPTDRTQSLVAGHLPSVSIVDDTLERHGEELARICAAAARR